MTTPPKHNGEAENSRARLREILEILGRHNIVRGLSPEKLRLILTDLGPTFVKLGQILSMRPDMIPKAYCEELTKLRSDVPPMPMEQVRRVVESSVGAKLEDVFASFDEKPLGSASIAQAHAAVLKGGGRVVVKVQREGIYDVMAQDIALMRKACGILKLAAVSGEVIDFGTVLDEIWLVSQEEMNFMTEATNAEKFYALNEDVAFVTCPRIHRELTTPRVLTMEYIDGCAIDDKDTLRKEGYDLAEIGAKLADNYIKQIVEDGFFHADPHPGNLRVRDGTIVFIDMGMMGHLSAREQTLLGKGVTAFARRDIEGIRDVVLSIGKCGGKINNARLYTDIDDMMSRYGDAELGGMNLSRFITDCMDVAKAHHIAMPSSLTMLARGLSAIEGVVADLSPEADIMSIVASRVSGSLLENLDFDKTLRHTARSVYESSMKALDIPSLVSDVLKGILKAQTRLNVDISAGEDAQRLCNAVVEKLVACFLACALIVAGGLLWSASHVTAGGVCFALAACLGVWLTYRLHRDGKL